MEHVHSSYACVIFQISLTHWVKFEPKFYAKIVQQCVISSLWGHPIILFYFLTKSDGLAHQISFYIVIIFFWRSFFAKKCNKDNIAIQPFPRFDPLFANPLFVQNMVFNERLTVNVSL